MIRFILRMNSKALIQIYCILTLRNLALANEAVPDIITKSNTLPFYRIHENYYLEIILQSFKTYSTFSKLNSKMTQRRAVKDKIKF